mmetsp:Transcript_21455/g.46497  ORF Transcript_21455/g.46497 Transcript_21455/m.46497 type:complete len:508 (-) Transcript_21455:146-1669(-)|eukprot:CAMPEP_0168782728 /NCGR_PEP_ID=MMETSP0725-20121227/9315_1 /TAXON_ID=265536 /ORGANISM="Amphiprora sp., Strain CCMP467" /LENGTH=507 /DNA_ID=CAMNT_0008832673 /DNA_START=76 /DNA_END=1599 /DNA_ORIENTATION=-
MKKKAASNPFRTMLWFWLMVTLPCTVIANRAPAPLNKDYSLNILPVTKTKAEASPTTMVDNDNVTSTSSNATESNITTVTSQDDDVTDQPPRRHADPTPGVAWGEFGFGLNDVETNAMWLQTVNDATTTPHFPKHLTDDDVSQYLQPMGPLSLSPASTVLNYGQALFEGLKAFRRADGRIALFRPQRNAERMQQGAQRYLLPSVPTPAFCRAVHAVVRANAAWVPPHGQGALYLRPLLLGTGAALGVKPSTQATFCIYASPVGNYFPTTGTLQPIRLQAVQGYTRASPGGSGHVKAAGNYAPAFALQQQVRNRGFDELLCLDVGGHCVEEAGASNFFIVYHHNRTLVTPPLSDKTILPGITRQSILELARRECQYKVVERPITLSELMMAAMVGGKKKKDNNKKDKDNTNRRNKNKKNEKKGDHLDDDNSDDCFVSEAFCCGTGAVITPVGSISLLTARQNERSITFHGFQAGPVTQRLYQLLTDIQSGTDAGLAHRYRKWIDIVEP